MAQNRLSPRRAWVARNSLGSVRCAGSSKPTAAGLVSVGLAVWVDWEQYRSRRYAYRLLLEVQKGLNRRDHTCMLEPSATIQSLRAMQRFSIGHSAIARETAFDLAGYSSPNLMCFLRHSGNLFRGDVRSSGATARNDFLQFLRTPEEADTRLWVGLRSRPSNTERSRRIAQSRFRSPSTIGPA